MYCWLIQESFANKTVTIDIYLDKKREDTECLMFFIWRGNVSRTKLSAEFIPEEDNIDSYLNKEYKYNIYFDRAQVWIEGPNDS